MPTWLRKIKAALARRVAKKRSHNITNIALAVSTALAVAGAPPALHNAEVLTFGKLGDTEQSDGHHRRTRQGNPFWGNVALRVLCSTIGYSAVNTILWDYRKRNQVPEITSTIDWFNDDHGREASG
jgi:hypothetical protein